MKNWLQEYRKKKGLTQAELAGKAGVSLTWIRMIEQGKSKTVSGIYAERISQALGVPVARVFPPPGVVSDEKPKKKVNVKKAYPKDPHIKFQIDRTRTVPSSWLEINGMRIRFLNLEVKTNPGQMPLVKIEVYAQLLEGEIRGAMGKVEIIHLNAKKERDWKGPGGRPDGCPASQKKD